MVIIIYTTTMDVGDLLLAIQANQMIPKPSRCTSTEGTGGVLSNADRHAHLDCL